VCFKNVYHFNADFKDPLNVPKDRPQHKEGGFFGKKVDSISFYVNELYKLEEQIYSARSKPVESYPSNSSAFVSFSTINGAHKTARKLGQVYAASSSSGIGLSPRSKLAPKFDDIIWENISMDSKKKWMGQILSVLITIGLIIAWTFIQAFVYTLSQLDKWRSIPGIGEYVTSSKFMALFIQSLFVPLVTLLLNMFLPKILRLMSRIQGVKSETGVERSTLTKFFFFLVYQFVVFIGGSIIETFVISVFTNPDQAASKFDLRLLGFQFVKNSTYYVTVTITGYAALALEIIQAAPFVIKFIKKKWFANTLREEIEVRKSPLMDYMISYGVLIFTFFNCMAYSIVAPFILLIATLFFWLAFVVMNYQLQYVYETKINSGGLWFPLVFQLLCISMAGFQLTTFGAIVILSAWKSGGVNGKSQSASVFALIVITALFYIFIRMRTAPKAAFVERDHEESGSTDANEESLEAQAFNPCMVKPLEKPMVRESQRVLLRTFYNPPYASLMDYVRKTDPNSIEAQMRLESQRQRQIALLEARKSIDRSSATIVDI
jgi:hypothetical protein